MEMPTSNHSSTNMCFGGSSINLIIAYRSSGGAMAGLVKADIIFEVL